MNDDTISRQAAMDAVDERLMANDYNNVALVSELNRLYGILARLPSAERRGRWIAVENDVDYYPFMCSECYETVIKKTNYCPRCGSRMNMEDKNE